MKRRADQSLCSGQGIDPGKLTKAIKREQTEEKAESRKASNKMIEPNDPSTAGRKSQDSGDREFSLAQNESAIGTSTSSFECKPEVDMLSDERLKRESSSPDTSGVILGSIPSESKTSTERSKSELQMKSIEALRIAANVPNRGLPNLRKKMLMNPDVYSTARRRLLVFDYDGTLTALVSDPSQAIAPPNILTALAQLATVPENSVWIVSGRERKFLEKLFPVSSDIGLFAEHGAYHRLPHQSDWHGDRTATDYPWWTAMLSRMQTFVATIPGSHVEVKDLALGWHYRACQFEGSIIAPAYRALLEAMAARSGWMDCKISEGSCIIEIGPRSMNKGFAVQFILAQMERATGQLPKFLLCIGDDVTDEGESLNSYFKPGADCTDMFAAVSVSRVLPQHRFCCKVYSDINTSRSNHAPYSAEGPEDVWDLINQLKALHGWRTSAPKGLPSP